LNPSLPSQYSLTKNALKSQRCSVQNFYMVSKGFGTKVSGKKFTVLGKGKKMMEKQMKHYNKLRSEGALVNDIYVREKDGERFIFIGKIARKAEIHIDQAIQLQKLLIIDHSKKINRLYGEKLQVWFTEGDKEIKVASNELGLSRTSTKAPSVEGIEQSQIGFMPEIYEQGEKVFSVSKADDGSCLRAPVSPNIVSQEELAAANAV